MELNDLRVVVTGGAGFIGSHVVDQLVAHNDVLVIDDFSSGDRRNLAHHDHARLEIVDADVRDTDAMVSLLDGADLVVHMAVACLRLSLSDPGLVHDVNATGTLRVCEAAHRQDVRRLVYVSSSEAYGSAVDAPMAEHHPLLPMTVYGASKAAGELYAQAYFRTYGMETVVVRPFNSYGPREHADGSSAEVIPKFVLRALSGRPPVVFGDGKQTRDFTWVEDTARGILQAGAEDSLVGQAVNIARGVEVSIADIADRVLGAVGRADLTPVFQDARPGDVDRHFADVAFAQERLGFRADVDVDTGIRRYVDWLRAQDIDLADWARREVVRNW